MFLNKRVSINKKTKKQSQKVHRDPLWARPQSGSLQFGKIDPTGRFIGHNQTVEMTHLLTESPDVLNDVINEYDDDWNLDNFDSKSAKKSGTSDFERKLKFKLGKIMNLMPLGSNASKSSEDLEIAEQMAHMLVREVEQDNQLI